MKSIGIFLFVIFLNCFAFGQSDPLENFNSHKFPCDTATTTLEINICAGIKSEYADSLLNDLYNKIIKSIDRDINENKKELKLKQSQKDSSPDRKEYIQFLIKQIEYDQRLKISIIKSQREWIKVRDLNLEVVSITCEGGRECIAIENLSELDDILERIKKLQSFYDVDN